MAKFEAGTMIVGKISGEWRNFQIVRVEGNYYVLDSGVSEFEDSVESIDAEFEDCAVVDDRNKRIKALADHLDIEPEKDETLEDYIQESDYDSNVFEAESNEYLVVTDSEADEKAAEYIKESLWSFNAEFLQEYMSIPIEAIRAIQSAMSEDANETFKQLLGDRLEEFISDAISADGRGHFMNSYDGHEWQEGEFYIYRIN